MVRANARYALALDSESYWRCADYKVVVFYYCDHCLFLADY
jgi:hypothetical protein